MIQAVQWLMIHEGIGAQIPQPRFEPLAFGDAMVWKYRGQVVPKNGLIQVEAMITARDDTSATANCSLWVDGLRIYEAKGLKVRVTSGATPH